MRQFVRAVDENTRPPEDLADDLHLTAIGWAVDESMETSRPVKVRTFDI